MSFLAYSVGVYVDFSAAIALHCSFLVSVKVEELGFVVSLVLPSLHLQRLVPVRSRWQRVARLLAAMRSPRGNAYAVCG